MVFRSLGVSVVPREGKRLLTGPMTLAGLALVACAAIRVSGLDHGGFSFCYFKSLTGQACMTCGTTRAFGHLARFDIPNAFAIQPLVTAGTLGLMLWAALDLSLLTVGKRTVIRTDRSGSRVILAVGIILAGVNWVYLLATGV